MEIKMKKILASLMFASVFLTANIHSVYANSSSMQEYSTPQEAQAHCPNDTVVWLNTRTGIYHFRGQRWYGNTRQGAYECRREANKEGDRPTHNGQ